VVPSSRRRPWPGSLEGGLVVSPLPTSSESRMSCPYYYPYSTPDPNPDRRPGTTSCRRNSCTRRACVTRPAPPRSPPAINGARDHFRRPFPKRRVRRPRKHRLSPALLPLLRRRLQGIGPGNAPLWATRPSSPYSVSGVNTSNADDSGRQRDHVVSTYHRIRRPSGSLSQPVTDPVHKTAFYCGRDSTSPPEGLAGVHERTRRSATVV